MSVTPPSMTLLSADKLSGSSATLLSPETSKYAQSYNVKVGDSFPLTSTEHATLRGKNEWILSSAHHNNSFLVREGELDFYPLVEGEVLDEAPQPLPSEWWSSFSHIIRQKHLEQMMNKTLMAFHLPEDVAASMPFEILCTSPEVIRFSLSTAKLTMQVNRVGEIKIVMIGDGENNHRHAYFWSEETKWRKLETYRHLRQFGVDNDWIFRREYKDAKELIEKFPWRKMPSFFVSIEEKPALINPPREWLDACQILFPCPPKSFFEIADDPVIIEVSNELIAITRANYDQIASRRERYEQKHMVVKVLTGTRPRIMLNTQPYLVAEEFGRDKICPCCEVNLFRDGLNDFELHTCLNCDITFRLVEPAWIPKEVAEERLRNQRLLRAKVERLHVEIFSNPGYLQDEEMLRAQYPNVLPEHPMFAHKVIGYNDMPDERAPNVAWTKRVRASCCTCKDNACINNYNVPIKIGFRPSEKFKTFKDKLSAHETHLKSFGHPWNIMHPFAGFTAPEVHATIEYTDNINLVTKYVLPGDNVFDADPNLWGVVSDPNEAHPKLEILECAMSSLILNERQCLQELASGAILPAEGMTQQQALTQQQMTRSTWLNGIQWGNYAIMPLSRLVQLNLPRVMKRPEFFFGCSEVYRDDAIRAIACLTGDMHRAFDTRLFSDMTLDGGSFTPFRERALSLPMPMPMHKTSTFSLLDAAPARTTWATLAAAAAPARAAPAPVALLAEEDLQGVQVLLAEENLLEICGHGVICCSASCNLAHFPNRDCNHGFACGGFKKNICGFLHPKQLKFVVDQENKFFVKQGWEKVVPTWMTNVNGRSQRSGKPVINLPETIVEKPTLTPSDFPQLPSSHGAREERNIVRGRCVTCGERTELNDANCFRCTSSMQPGEMASAAAGGGASSSIASRFGCLREETLEDVSASVQTSDRWSCLVGDQESESTLDVADTSRWACLTMPTYKRRVLLAHAAAPAAEPAAPEPTIAEDVGALLQLAASQASGASLEIDPLHQQVLFVDRFIKKIGGQVRTTKDTLRSLSSIIVPLSELHEDVTKKALLLLKSVKKEKLAEIEPLRATLRSALGEVTRTSDLAKGFETSLKDLDTKMSTWLQEKKMKLNLEDVPEEIRNDESKKERLETKRMTRYTITFDFFNSPAVAQIDANFSILSNHSEVEASLRTSWRALNVLLQQGCLNNK